MSKLFSDFLNDVMPDVPGCTTEIAQHAIKNTIIDFCEKSLILQRDHDPVSVAANVIDYDFDPPDNFLVIKIMRAWYKNKPLEPVSPDDIDKPEVYNQLFEGASVAGAEPNAILQKSERQFTIYPIPSEAAANAITMRVALKPTRSSEEVDDVIYEDYSEIIAYGAKARLMMSPNKPYTNPQLAVSALGMYQSGLGVARQRATRGYYVRSDLKVKLLRI